MYYFPIGHKLEGHLHSQNYLHKYFRSLGFFVITRHTNMLVSVQSEWLLTDPTKQFSHLRTFSTQQWARHVSFLYPPPPKKNGLGSKYLSLSFLMWCPDHRTWCWTVEYGIAQSTSCRLISFHQLTDFLQLFCSLETFAYRLISGWTDWSFPVPLVIQTLD